MILDNRQGVPDIIVSRDGVPNSIAYNINNNFNNNQDHNQGGQLEKARPENVSPRHLPRGRPHEVPKYAYVTGNNNGSPRHVPHNGNYYSEAKMSPVVQRANKVINRDSPVHSKSSNLAKYHVRLDDSPQHVPLFENTSLDRNQKPQKVVQNQYASPVHYRYNLQRNPAPTEVDYQASEINYDMETIKKCNLSKGSPKKCNDFYKDCSYVSPVHQMSSHVRQGIYYSPKHHPKNNHLFSPRRGSPFHLEKKDNGDTVGKDTRFHFFPNEKFRPRSSSHPCEGSSFVPSKIPVQVTRPLRLSSLENEVKSSVQNNKNQPNAYGSPFKTFNERQSLQNTNLSNRKGTSPDLENQEYKRILREYAIFSPKKVIAHSKNQNLKIQRARTETNQKLLPTPKENCKTFLTNRKDSIEPQLWNGNTWQWNTGTPALNNTESSNFWNIETEQKSEEENDPQQMKCIMKDTNIRRNYIRGRSGSLTSSGSIKSSYSEADDEPRHMKISGEGSEALSDKDSGVEPDDSLGSKMVLIKCKDANYLTRIFVNSEGIHGLRVVGRVGVGGSAQGHVMSVDQSEATPGDLNSNHNICNDDVRGGCDVTNREVLSENTGSLISQATDTEFEHEAADYQWLLDYEYRESYSRESNGGGRDGSTRVSVLQPPTEESHLSYETLSRNIDANLAEIDMDDFRSEDIHQLLSLPNICADLQDGNEEDIYCSVTGSLIDVEEITQSPPPHQPNRCMQPKPNSRLHQKLLKQHQQQQHHHQRKENSVDDNEQRHTYQQDQAFEDEEHEEEIEEEYSGVSGDVSLYQSGPLFSPLKDPPHIPPSFSVDSLDSDSIHEDLILTCQANKNNYTIAFEGSFVHYSEDSDYQEPPESDGTASGTWSTERLEGRSPAPNMTYSDQPYTTWSRVSRRSSQSRTPDPSQTNPSRPHDQSPLPTDKPQQQSQTSSIGLQPSQQQGSKSNSMPNLMRRSLMRKSLETSGHCMKVYDLQNSLRSSQLSNARSVDANNFSLMRLFIKQKSLSKEAVSLSSSCTDPSQEGACSSSENQSGVNDSSDWPMNSQSENDMDGSASPVPMTALNNHVHDRVYRGRGNSPNMILASSQDNPTNNTERNSGSASLTTEGILNNNNLTHNVDNVISNPLDNLTSFEDSLKEPNPCSKPPMTSPIREEPEGMDISLDSRCENKVLLDQAEKEGKTHEVLRLKDNNVSNAEQNNRSSSKTRDRENSNCNNKNAFNITSDKKKRSESPGTPNHKSVKTENSNATQRKRQDSGNASSGYASNKGSTEKMRRSSESDKSTNISEKPKPKPRSLKQVTDQCLQTSNLKVSATVNTSGIMDKKDIYVYYPNYALPDLGFLKEKKYSVDARIFLVPQHYSNFNHDRKSRKDVNSKRPFSCGDMEKLKKHGFSHVRDWESLNFLLPKELKEMLLDDTECIETVTPSFCKPTKVVRRPTSCEYSQQKLTQESKESKVSSSSLTSNQPSSGFRGSSTMLNDSEEGAANLDHRYVYRYDSTCMDSENGPPVPKRNMSLGVEEHLMEDGAIPPPRPPLPRGILRKCTSLREDQVKQSGSKRHSAGDTSSKISLREDLLKRRSLQEPIHSSEISNELSPPTEDADDKMKCSCISECTGFCAKGLRKKNLLLVDELPEVSSHEELTESDLVRLRSQVSDFLVMKGNQVGSILTGDFTYGGCDCSRKNVSFAEKSCAHRQHASNPTSFSRKGQKESTDPKTAKKPSSDEDRPPMLYDAHDKKTLVLSVRSAVEKLVMHFNKGASQQDKNRLGTSLQTPEVSQLALDKLCPAIYALLSDGLLTSLHSLFGKISNSVWRVVEATSQIGPSTKALNDLVLTLNSEECLSEGPIKFNAFIFGLLNIRSLDAWLGYLRTRESALQKHYHPESFLYLSNTATRGLYDDLLLSLRPLALLPFRLDLLHEYKALHASLLKMEERLALHTSQSPTDPPLDILLAAKESKEFRNAAARTTDRSRSPRPRSCYENSSAHDNMQGALRKRWSGVQLGSKLVTAIDKLLTEEAGGTSSEDYSDSLDNPKKSHRHNHDASDETMTDMRVSDLSSKDGDISERSATDKDTDTEKGLRLLGKHMEKENESEGERFRRLQLKWEAMTGHNCSGQKVLTKEEEEDQERLESVTSPAGAQRSRIPRPVSITSPQQVFKPFEASRDKISPQYKQGKKLLPPKDHPKPAPRRSLKDRVVPTEHNETQFGRGPAVRARVGPRNSSSNNSLAFGPNRASSVPGRKVERGSSGSRLVQTLHHRLATDNGHLSFSRGDVLTIIVEVDERFLLCCLHDRKGLVPRSSVVVYH